MKQTLLHSSEIGGLTGFQDVPPCDLANIRLIERKAFMDCLGIDFYNYLLSQLANYDPCIHYNANDSYDSGHVVYYEGTFYEATLTNSNLPTDSRFWKLAPKFSNECLNDLWCNYLGVYLAWLVIENRLPYLLVRVAAMGAVKGSSQYSEAAERADVNMLHGAVERDCKTALDCLHNELMSDKECYALYKEKNKAACGECGHVKQEYRKEYSFLGTNINCCSCADKTCIEEQTEQTYYRAF